MTSAAVQSGRRCTQQTEDWWSAGSVPRNGRVADHSSEISSSNCRSDESWICWPVSHRTETSHDENILLISDNEYTLDSGHCPTKVKVNQSTCIAPCIVQTTLKHSGMDHTAFNLQRTPCLPLPRKRSPDGASTEYERLSWPGWLTYSGRLTHISGHLSATGRAQDGERTLARDWRSTAEPRGPTTR